MTVRRYLLIGALFYLALLIATAPAQGLAWAVNRGTHGLARIDGASGTLWDGKGVLTISVGGIPAALGSLRWRVHPAWLLLGRIDASLQLAGPSRLTASGDVRAAVREVTARNVRVAFQPALIARFYPPAAIAGLDGEIALSSAGFEIEKTSVSGAADIEWRNAATGISSVKPLGDYRAELRAQQANLTAKVSTLRGDLVLNGDGRLAIGSGALQFNGSARAVNHAPQLEPLLQLLGGNVRDGQTSLRIQTKIF